MLRETRCQALPWDELHGKICAQDNDDATHNPAYNPYSEALPDQPTEDPDAAFTAFFAVAVPASRYKVFRIVDVCNFKPVQQPFHGLAALHPFHRKQMINCDPILGENPAAVGALIIFSLMA